jgi:hypothetical protein
MAPLPVTNLPAAAPSSPARRADGVPAGDSLAKAPSPAETRPFADVLEVEGRATRRNERSSGRGRTASSGAPGRSAKSPPKDQGADGPTPAVAAVSAPVARSAGAAAEGSDPVPSGSTGGAAAPARAATPASPEVPAAPLAPAAPAAPAAATVPAVPSARPEPSGPGTPTAPAAPVDERAARSAGSGPAASAEEAQPASPAAEPETRASAPSFEALTQPADPDAGAPAIAIPAATAAPSTGAGAGSAATAVEPADSPAAADENLATDANAADTPSARPSRHRADRPVEPGAPAVRALGEPSVTSRAEAAGAAPDDASHRDHAAADHDPGDPGHVVRDATGGPAEVIDGTASPTADATSGASFAGRPIGPPSAASGEASTRTPKAHAAAAELVIGQIVDRLRTFRADGAPAVETRFEDPQLGEIRLVITGHAGETLRAELVASSSQAADALGRALVHVTAAGGLDPLRQIDLRIRTADAGPAFGQDHGSTGRHPADPRESSARWSGDGSGPLGQGGRQANRDADGPSIEPTDRPAGRPRGRTAPTSRSLPAARPSGHGVDLRA